MSSKPGSVFVRKSWNSEESVVNILKRGVTIAKVKRARLPRTLLPAGITEERKKYSYEEIRPFVSPQYRDITCPRP